MNTLVSSGFSSIKSYILIIIDINQYRKNNRDNNFCNIAQPYPGPWSRSKSGPQASPKRPHSLRVLQVEACAFCLCPYLDMPCVRTDFELLLFSRANPQLPFKVALDVIRLRRLVCAVVLQATRPVWSSPRSSRSGSKPSGGSASSARPAAAARTRARTRWVEARSCVGGGHVQRCP